MAIEGPSVADVGEFMGELSGLYALGQVAEVANIEGGGKLRGHAIDLLAKFSDRMGVELPAAAVPESGSLVSMGIATARAFNWLRASAGSLLAGAAAAPGFTLALVGTVGTLSTIDSYLTQGERIELGKGRELGAVMQTAINGMTPEDRARFVASAAGLLAPSSTIGRLVFWGVGLGAAFLAWRWYSER